MDLNFKYTTMKSIILHIFSLIIFYMVAASCICFHLQIVNATSIAFENLLVFGDSVVDPGNNNNLITIAKSNYPPYGRDFVGHKPTGRFSNGKIPNDIIAEELGIKQLLPAYLDPNVQLKNLITGVTFASAGAGYDPRTAQSLNSLPLSDQLRMFEEYLANLTSGVGEEMTQNILSKTLFVICAGTDDLGITYFGITDERLLQDINSYTDLMLNYALDFYRKLFSLGARNIAVFGLPPLGCLPGKRTSDGGLLRQCAESENQAALLFNSKLSPAIDALNKDKQALDAKIAYIDIYNSLLSLIENAAQYGFEVTDQGCCGTETLGLESLCTPVDDVLSCKDASKYIFWDAYHPTQAAYEILTQQIVDNIHNLF